MTSFERYRYHKSVPLLDWCTEDLNMSLENVLLISCHHILESNLFLLHYLFEKKLKPENVWCLWKCYSSNQEVFGLYKDEWININEESLKFDPNISFQEQYSKNVEKFIQYVIEKNNFENFDKVIIWDDGWELLYQMNRLSVNNNNFFWIEHTSNWFHKLKNQGIKFPIINVARSETKLIQESPFIAKLSIKKFHKLTENHDLFPKKILIVWGGAIGNALKKELEQKYIVDIYDINKDKSTIFWTIEEIINNYDVVFWATGTNILSYELFKKLKNWMILVSASSWDYEFCSLDIRKKTNSLWIWDDLQLDWKWLLNWWFPITFTGEKEAAPLQEIQLTRWLIYWAIFQIVKTKFEGDWFVDLDENVQKIICDKFEELHKNCP
jgi:S-adenosylhomocysteine hydrolase